MLVGEAEDTIFTWPLYGRQQPSLSISLQNIFDVLHKEQLLFVSIFNTFKYLSLDRGDKKEERKWAMSYRANQDIHDKRIWSNESISGLEWIGSFLGVFEDKSGKVSSSQVFEWSG